MATNHIVKSYDEDLARLKSKLSEMGSEVEDQIFKANQAVAAQDEISIVGSVLVLQYVRQAAQNIARIDEFAATFLDVTGITGNQTCGSIQRTKSMSI